MSFQHPAQTRTGVTGHQVSTYYPLTAIAPPSFPSRPGTSILIDCCSEGSSTVGNNARHWTGKDIHNRCQCQLITFDVLPDDVLLEIFDFYLYEDIQEIKTVEGFELRIVKWIKLVHVCRRWRSVVFQSSHRLNLRLLCTHNTPRNTLDTWPPLPLVITCFNEFIGDESSRLDNIIAALEHNDRVCQIRLRNLTGLECVTDSAAMQNPFMELTDLQLSIFDLGPILPDSFLGGTAPRLRSLYLYKVPFPGLPKLLLSTTHLVKLDLLNIPRFGYIPPDAMATSLSALTNLESLHLHFQYPRPRPALESRRPPPPPLTRSILPSLTNIAFKGASEYLEDILARIDTPRLDVLDITFFNQIIFDTPQLFQFISRTPTLRAPEMGHIEFYPRSTVVKFRSQTSGYDGALCVQISCTASEWQVSSLEQVCNSSLPPVSTLEDLYISEGRGYLLNWQDDVERTLWLELLHPFAAVKNIYVSKKIMPCIAPALQELVGGRTTEVLPALENIFLEGFQPSGPLHEGIKRFVAARLLTIHPVEVFRWG